MKIKFGPAGMGPVRDVEHTFEEFAGLGIKAVEIPFTYGVFIKDKKTAHKVKKAAETFGISISIHAPYWINLNSAEKEKIEASKQRILKCLEVGTWLDAKVIVFHAGFYGKFSKEETYENIKNQILELQKIRKDKKFTPNLAPETMGKVNVFGSIDEIARLVQDTRCNFCVDFAHILARYKKYNFKEVFGKLKSKKFHVHFSGIEYGEKGEKKHVSTSEESLKHLLENLKKGKEYTIINEAPNPLGDTIKSLMVYEEFFD